MQRKNEPLKLLHSLKYAKQVQNASESAANGTVCERRVLLV